MGETSDDAVAARVGLRRRVPRWVVGALVLPVAVLASAATSRMEDSTYVISEGPDGWVVEQLEWHGDDLTGYGWTREAGEWIAPAEDAERDESNEAEPQWKDCSVAEPLVCYRGVEGKARVERSEDRGKTWVLEWQLTAEDLEGLAEEHYAEGGPGISATGIGVAQGPGGEEVWAAMGLEGLVVRHPDGTWERTGAVGLYAWADAPSPIPSERLAQAGGQVQRAIAHGAVWAAGFAVVAAAVAGVVLAAKRDRKWWHWLGVLAAMAPFSLLTFLPAAAAQDDPRSWWMGFGFAEFFSIVAWMVGAVMVLVVIGKVARMWSGARRTDVMWAGLGAGASGWIAGATLPGVGLHPSAGAAIGAAVGAAAVVVVAIKRRGNA